MIQNNFQLVTPVTRYTRMRTNRSKTKCTRKVTLHVLFRGIVEGLAKHVPVIGLLGYLVFTQHFIEFHPIERLGFIQGLHNKNITDANRNNEAAQQ